MRCSIPQVFIASSILSVPRASTLAVYSAKSNDTLNIATDKKNIKTNVIIFCPCLTLFLVATVRHYYTNIHSIANRQKLNFSQYTNITNYHLTLIRCHEKFNLMSAKLMQVILHVQIQNNIIV